VRDTLRFIWRWHRLSTGNRCCVQRDLIHRHQLCRLVNRRWTALLGKVAEKSPPVIIGLVE